ncbi:MAG: hypothetical protein IJJ40_05890 [Clostridia bacterium]|nr:hypothetical protein [Clostridia bacterium]
MNHRIYRDYIYYAVIEDENFLLAQNGYYDDEGYTEYYLIKDGKKDTYCFDIKADYLQTEDMPKLMRIINDIDFYNYLNGNATERKDEIDELLDGDEPSAFVMFCSIYDNFYTDNCYNGLCIITKDKMVHIPLS